MMGVFSMRRFIHVALAATAVVTLTGVALAQQGQPRTADDYICIFSGDCGNDEEPVATRDAPEVKGLRLVRPRAAAPARSAPATRPRASAAAAPRSPARATVRTVQRTSTVTRRASSAGAGAARADLRLTFESGSAVMTPSAREEARAFGMALQSPQLSSRRFRIEGHTDSVGGRSYNLDLSRRRAEAVAEYLQSLGVPRERIEIRGFGYDRPLPGRRGDAPANRRVEAVLIS